MRGRRGNGGETISRARVLRSFSLSSDIGILLRRLGLRHRSEAGIPRDSVQQGQQLTEGPIIPRSTADAIAVTTGCSPRIAGEDARCSSAFRAGWGAAVPVALPEARESVRVGGKRDESAGSY